MANPPEQSAEIDAFITRCMADFEYYAPIALKIATKTKGLQPFIFNEGQYYLHRICEQMLDKYGMVRVIICKARQIGFSTYVEARAYWRTSFNHAYNTMIIAHESEASKNLFNMAKRYHENCPPELRPHTKRSNAKELIFDSLDSRYSIATAKTGDAGRSQKINFMHLSEAAYYRNAEEISAGAMEGIPNEPDTEVFIESTAAGIGGWYHAMWQNAIYPGEQPTANWNGYYRIFVPWHWMQEYRIKPPENFELSEEEAELVDIYDLDAEQIAWRRQKIAAKKGDKAQFGREYPITPDEAFNSALDNVLINSLLVARARKNFNESRYQPVGRRMLGVDVARSGADDTCLVLRQGRVMLWYQRIHGEDSIQIAGRVIRAFKQFHIDHCCIDDTGGFGSGVIDQLRAYGWGKRVTGVHFNQNAIYTDLYYNKRAEIWCNVRDWLQEGAALPDRDEIALDLCAVTYEFDISGDRMKLEPKDKLKDRIGKSPDIADALALTFAIQWDGATSESYDPDMAY